MRVAILTEGEGSASEAFRVRWLLPALAREGIEATLFPSRPGKYEAMTWQRRLWKFGSAIFHAHRLANRLADFPRLRGFDAVLLQRDLLTYPTAALEWLLMQMHGRIVFDIDDALYLTIHNDGSVTESAARHRKIEEILRGSRAVAAGSRALMDFVRPIQPNVALVPTVVDTDLYRPQAVQNDPPVLGWVGVPSNQAYLRELVPVLRNFPKARVRVVTRHHLRFDLPNVEEVQWSREKEPGQVAAFDVGLSPLPDTPWARAKCGVRLLLYMACGVPPICSPVGANGEIVEDGVTGLHASGLEDWERAIDRLLNDPAERKRLGAAARARVEERYSVPVAARALAALLREAVR